MPNIKDHSTNLRKPVQDTCVNGSAGRHSRRPAEPPLQRINTHADMERRGTTDTYTMPDNVIKRTNVCAAKWAEGTRSIFETFHAGETYRTDKSQTTVEEAMGQDQVQQGLLADPSILEVQQDSGHSKAEEAQRSRVGDGAGHLAEKREGRLENEDDVRSLVCSFRKVQSKVESQNA